MSSIPELLKMGFDNDDWSYVSEAYHMLIGEYLLVEKPQSTIEEQHEGLHAEHQGFAKEVIQTEQSDYISKAYKGEHPEFHDGEGTQRARKEPMNLSKTREQWVDDGTIAANEKVSENPHLGVANPVDRNRRKSQVNAGSDVRLDKSDKLKEINE